LQAENPETGLTLDPPDTLPTPDENLINTEQMALVRESLDQLEEPCREIVELRYLGDLSYEELSATLKLNPKTVSSRLSRCLDRLEEIARKTFLRENPRVSRPMT
jgi:RNA polymerase sigma-70 factor (ECF subfamily)